MIKYNKVNFNNIDAKISELRNMMEVYKNKIVALYLFGSCHTGRMTPLSDIDIAILFDEVLGSEAIGKIESEIYLKLTKLFNTDEIDFIVLNKAPLSMQYGVLKHKELIYYSDKEKIVDFQCRVVSEYLDFKPMRDEINREFLLAMEGRMKING